jgi:ABC-type antimicrobial peptide transport system permease subunit
VRLVVWQGVSMAVGGIAIGLIAALALSRSMAAFLYGVTPHDAVTFVSVPLLLLVVTAIACFVPARRAARLDPLRALRAQ